MVNARPSPQGDTVLSSMADIRDADVPGDLPTVRRLWLEYLTWGNDGLESRFGFRLPVEGAVEEDVATIAKFQPPEGRLLVAFEHGEPVGTSCMRRISAGICEIKRMWVDPRHRGSGIGRAMLDRLIEVARLAGYARVRLDSPRFMTAAHNLYRSCGFASIAPYPESEIPDEYKSHWVFMEKRLG
jgi:GNAT superfamily N-acetyltransferase